MQTAYISILMQGCNWNKSKLLLQKSRPYKTIKSQKTEMDPQETGGTEVSSGAQEREKSTKIFS